MREERYLIADGDEYVDVDCVREALGIKDDENIFLAIKKLKEERERYKSNCDYFAGIAQDRLCDRNKLELELCQALGTVDEYADIPGLVRKLKQERDKLKDRLRTYRLIANGTYGDSCGYSGDKAPAFRCNVISYSWEFSPINACTLGCGPSYRVRDDSIRVELSLTPTANYKGTFDLEDLKKYIQEYGREEKLGIIESVDYQNAKAARAELAYLYKQVLGKEKLDMDLSPHEVMKAILDAVKKLRDAQFASDQCLRSVYMHVYEDTGYDISDIYAAPDKLADGIITRYDATKTLGHMETACDINDFIDELCDKHNVIQPARSKTTRERLDYIFSALTDYRNMADSNFNKAVEFRKEKQAVENSLAELRAKVREIYCSVVDDEWDEYLAYTSALNDINEEYKRVVHNFEERTADWSKAQQELDRYKLAVGSLCNIPAEHRDDISWIEDAFSHSKKEYLKWQTQADKLARFRSNICTALCLGGETRDEDILNAITKARKKCNDLIVFRNDVAKAIGLTWKDNDSDIINRVMGIRECHDKLCKDYTELRKAIWEAMDRKPETLPEETARLVGEVAELARGEKLLIEFRDAVAEAIGMDYPTTNQVLLNSVQYIYKDRKDAYELVAKINDKVTELVKAKEDLQQKFDASQKQLKDFTNRCDSLEDLRRDLWELRRNAIEDLKSRGFRFRPEENETLPEIYDKLLKRYDWAYGVYKEQYRLRQMWHVRYESEHERANGVQKKLDKLRGIEEEKDKLEKFCKYWHDMYDSSETARGALTGKIRELKDEKTKVISALGQDIWDDCLK